VRGTHKITASHMDRLALIYLRQSSMAQVRENTESTARQYALADEAVRLGWPASQVEVIDTDLGLSGRSAANRSGFKDLVGRVCLGEVGAIFGLEISRLARSSADLSRLLVQDPPWSSTPMGSTTWPISTTGSCWASRTRCRRSNFTSWPAGCKGARQAAAERGELRVGLPVGSIYDDEGRMIVDP
jgi:hypothetical protein